MIRILDTGDEAAVEAFLARHADTSMILRSNLRRAGLRDAGAPFQGTYAALVEGGSIEGVVSHAWIGNALVQCPRLEMAGALVRAAARACGRPLKGLIGPWGQIDAARDQLGLRGAAANLAAREALMALPLEDLRVPAALAEGRVVCRHSEDADLDLLARWRYEYNLETGMEAPRPGLAEDCRKSIELSHRDRLLWVLTEAGRPVASTAFNARVTRADGSPEIVQVGGVWTPVELRGRGHARCAVAGQLLEARSLGATRAVLFTGEDRGHAQSAYRALGFQECGDYGLIFFADPPALHT